MSTYVPAPGPGRNLIWLTWPILCSSLLGVLDTSVNVIWVGRELGDVAVAALSNANLLWTLLFAASFGISMAGSVRIGRSLGEGNVKDAKAAVGTMISASGMVSVVCILPMMVYARPLLDCLGTPAASLPQAVQYLRTLLLSVPLTYSIGAVLAVLRAAGNSKAGFYLSVAWVAVDAALNPVFIVGIGPIPRIGIAGSALATLVGQAIGLGSLLFQCYGQDHVLCLSQGDLGLLRIDFRSAVNLFRDGGPMAVQFLWSSIEEMLMISLVNRFGVHATAAYGVVIQVWNFIMMPANALSVAITALVAQNIGAGRWDRVQKLSRVGLAYGALATAALVMLAEILGAHAYSFFLPEGSPSLGFAEEIDREATWSLIIVGGYTVWLGVLRATGAVWAPLAISAVVLTVRFPVTAALSSFWHTQAIWWSFPASAAVTTSLAALHWRLRSGPQRILWRNSHGV